MRKVWLLPWGFKAGAFLRQIANWQACCEGLAIVFSGRGNRGDATIGVAPGLGDNG